MIFPDCVRHDAAFPVYGVAVGRVRWPDRYHPNSRDAGEWLLVRRVTLKRVEVRHAANSVVWECRAE